MLKKHECSITQKISVINGIVEMHDSRDIVHIICNFSAGAAIVNLNLQGYRCHLPPELFNELKLFLNIFGSLINGSAQCIFLALYFLCLNVIFNDMFACCLLVVS